ncbi:hypothetical protein ACP70R_032377 [Stipagrostis hirtigluma subsp. patula]
MDGADPAAAAGGIVLSAAAPAPEGGDWHMEGLNPAAAAATGEGVVVGDWRRQLDTTARHRIVSVMLKALKKHLPMSDPAGQSRLQKIAEGIENNSYNTATNKSNYFKNISLMLLYVESPYQKQHHPAPGPASQGNNPAHSSAVTLMSQQQTWQLNTSSVQASSLPSLDQSSSGVSQTSVWQSMSGQSTIPQIQLMAIQSDTHIGIQQYPLNTVQQSVLSIEHCVPEPRMTEFGLDDDKGIFFEKEQSELDSCFLDSDWTELVNWDATQAPLVSDTQMENCDAEVGNDSAFFPLPSPQEDDQCRTARLAAREDPNYIFMANMETNAKKRKFDGPSSSSA